MTDTPDLITLTADITSAFLSNNKVAAGDVAGLIAAIHGALEGASRPAPAEPAKQAPAVSIRSSVKADSIACLECGKRAKMLKRHLSTVHAMTPAEYREKWGLPRDYPMVSSDYAAQRATLAKTIGLGRTKAGAIVEAVAAPVRTARRKLGIAAAKAAAVAHLGGEQPAPAKRARPAKAPQPVAEHTGEDTGQAAREE